MWHKTLFNKIENVVKKSRDIYFKIRGYLNCIKGIFYKILKVFLNLICRISVIIWKMMCFLLTRFLRTFSYIIVLIDEQRQIDGQMAKHGVLFLSFSLLLLAIKQPNSSPDLPLFPSSPDYLSIFWKVILIVLSLILIILVFWLWKKYKLAKLFNGRLIILAYIIIAILWFFIVWFLNPLIPLIPVYGYKGLGLSFLIISTVFIFAVFWKWLAKKLVNIIEGRFQVFYWIMFWLVYTIGWLKGLAGIPPESVPFPFAFYIGFIWFLIIGIIMLKSTGQIRRQ